MADLDQIPQTYEEAIQTLAEWHGTGASGVEIYSFPHPTGQLIQFVEVSEEFPANGWVAPVRMGASAEFPFASSVALVSPGEWNSILDGGIELPEGWDLSRREKVWPR